jgi:hypothetical protein
MSKANKTAMIRARCTTTLKGDIAWAAQVESLDEADIVRKATAEYVLRLRHRLNPPVPFPSSPAPLANAA